MTLSLKTKRLVLRAPRLEDTDAIAEGVGDYEVARFLTAVPHPYSRKMARDWLAGAPQNTPERNCFIIELEGSGLVGCISLLSELGYWIARPHWGKGLVTEAAARLISWHFTETQTEEMHSSAHVDNVASLAVQKKLGFVEHGRSYRFSQACQHNIEHVETRLTRSAFIERGWMQ
ncbi:GNAT family N-acetyltransferase [Devosia nitrariae]|uniref:N-acetyltransferase n=1 Tax=Devosia nitrariae TaxID=2071872 RepID=A0ABQ5W2K7_9HYPH|nr:GNAT family N-acetyltransferase [Devosia nitrariae]GLQ54320.1 N-acetyltransferase [Devosia nitrariae]